MKISLYLAVANLVQLEVRHYITHISGLFKKRPTKKQRSPFLNIYVSRIFHQGKKIFLNRVFLTTYKICKKKQKNTK